LFSTLLTSISLNVAVASDWLVMYRKVFRPEQMVFSYLISKTYWSCMYISWMNIFASSSKTEIIQKVICVLIQLTVSRNHQKSCLLHFEIQQQD
jgi:hypothetical protein